MSRHEAWQPYRRSHVITKTVDERAWRGKFRPRLVGLGNVVQQAHFAANLSAFTPLAP
ncbi:hypothetical protein QR685DRAFT_550369 [Neurospora intermedia]|uniref:Uncharacterized protein n=1 Tax=Neurospora intermedia TaxID=5142 RepID=A0ABR3DT25_NEUIN